MKFFYNLGASTKIKPNFTAAGPLHFESSVVVLPVDNTTSLATKS